jgi:metal-dependent amidase/aminoacylase/carboxypeptidase family protein
MPSSSVRTEKIRDLNILSDRMKKVFEGSALASGCTVEIIDDPAFADVLINKRLAIIFENHAKRLGCTFPSIEKQQEVPYGSTDMGNVTNVVPGIHPIFAIGCAAEIHTIEFREQAVTMEAHAATLRAAKCLAMTGLDCILDPLVVADATAEFQTAVGHE